MTMLDPDQLPDGVTVEGLTHKARRPTSRKRFKGTVGSDAVNPKKMAAFMENAVNDECGRTTEAAQGERHTQLYKSACNVGELVATGYLGRATAESALLAAAEAAGLLDGKGAQPETERQAIQDGLNKGAESPRDIEHVGRDHVEIVEQPAARPSRKAGKPARAAFGDTLADGFNATDWGNARRLVAAHSKTLRHASALGWMYFDGKIWCNDVSGAVYRAMKQCVSKMYKSAAECSRDKDRTSLVSFALKCEAQSKIEAAVKSATTEKELSLSPTDLDTEHHHLNLENGILDLGTRKLTPHTAEALHSKIANVKYDPAARCPFWESHFEMAFAGDQDLTRFMQRALGYALADQLREQVVFVCHGRGENGKSTITENFLDLMGSYAVETEFETVAESKSSAGEARPELLDLRGARFVLTAESSAGQRLNESLIKRLTGGNMLSARALYQTEFVKFRPGFKIFIEANHRPIIRNVDHAIWRRIKQIPFTVTIPKEMKRPKNEVDDAIHAEFSGILNWLLDGYDAWLSDGLGSCQAVDEATEDYRDEMDPLAEFIDEHCCFDGGGWASTGELRRTYARWCETTHRHLLSPQRFGILFGQRAEVHARKFGGRRGWDGVVLT